ncbi:MAG: Hsp20/alpha crystallin family protein [Acidobacteria bacterium]|nr:Hsp20/alpha crystallin family protein [Acidobacteriota bacterium]
MIFPPDFFAELRKIELEMKDLVQRAGGSSLGRGPAYASLTPPLDIYEKDGYLVLIMDVPGVEPEDLKIQYSHGFLIIAGRKAAPKYERKRNFVCLERNFGTFSRKIYIQRPLDFSDVHAVLQDGILTLRLKLREERRGGPISIPVEQAETDETEMKKTVKNIVNDENEEGEHE